MHQATVGKNLNCTTINKNLPIHNTFSSSNVRGTIQLGEGCGRMDNVGSSNGVLERVVAVEGLIVEEKGVT